MNHKKYQSKSLFIWGTIACIGLSSNLNATFSDVNAGSLVSSEVDSQNKRTNASDMSLKDVDTLRQQLQKKTKELQEYKAKLFRPSHPEDQAKIVALSRRISEYEKTKQVAINEIQSLKDELQKTLKQIQELEEFSLALHTIIEGQEAINLAENAKTLEFMAKTELLERDWNTEKNLTNQLQAEMAVLKDLLALQEKQIATINQQRDEEFESISFQATLLKSEFDKELHMLKSELAEIIAGNEKLKLDHEALSKTYLEAHAKIDENHHERQSFALNLLEHEEALAKAKEDYESAKTEYTLELKSLSDDLSFHKDNLALMLTEKSSLDESLEELKNRIDEIAAENLRLRNENDDLANSKNDTLAKHDEHLNEMQALALNLIDHEQALEQSRENYQKIQEEHSEYINKLNEQLSEQRDNLSAALNEKQAIDQDFQNLKCQMDEISQEKARLQNDIEALNKSSLDSISKNDEHHQERQSLALNILELEEALSDAKQNHEKAKDEYASEINRLTDELKKHETSISATLEEKKVVDQDLEILKSKIDEINAENAQLQEEKKALDVKIQETLAKHEEYIQENHSLKTSLSNHEEALKNAYGKHEEYDQEKQSLALNLLENEDLLNQYKLDNDALKTNHESLKADHHEKVGQLCNQLDDHKAMLTSAVSEKERLALLHEQDRDNLDALTSEIEKIRNENLELLRKTQESEKAVQSLTVVAQQQDQALAKANAIFSMVQEYNGQLEQEIAILKDRLNESEAAHRKIQKMQELDNEMTETTHGVSKTIKKLMNSVSGGA